MNDLGRRPQRADTHHSGGNNGKTTDSTLQRPPSHQKNDVRCDSSCAPPPPFHRRPTYVVIVVVRATKTATAADYIVPQVRIGSATTAMYVVHAASEYDRPQPPKIPQLIPLWARDLFRSTRDRYLTLNCKHYDDVVVDRSRTWRVTKLLELKSVTIRV